MSDVFPRSNLPDDAVPWGRAHDDRVIALEATVGSIAQSVQGQNRNSASSLAVIAKQIQKIADQQQILIDQQAELSAQQTQLSSQQAALTNTVNFLATQTVSDSRGNADGYTGANTGTTWRGFDATYDCAVAVTTGSAGRLLIQASANLTAGGLTAVLGIQIDGVLGPGFPGPYCTYVTNASAGASRVVTAVLAPNTAYTVRLRRGITGDTSGSVAWRDQSLAVTRS